MRRRPLSARVSSTMMKLAFAFLVALVMRTPVGLAQTEEPSAAAMRFYGEYMGMGVALKPLGERWFTARSGRGPASVYVQHWLGYNSKETSNKIPEE